ncbi:MAG: Ni/Fe-hydrogenase 1 B-type cytochrome subunit [Comamonadaceae bacterium]|nr:MAG: Ni/Fe-hydrogenase 1 B-type cytochrome subunit [Comamonadaceae bacterium]
MNTSSASPTPGELHAALPTEVEELSHSKSIKSTYVYEAPVRLWHWVNALAITVLCLTGYFIGSPLPTMPGEASDHFLMGYIRFAHFSAAYILTIGLLGRSYWALVGNHHARELYSVPIFQREYWHEIGAMLKWYAFMGPSPGPYVGHNPLARFAMFFVFLFTALFMIFTGFALYGEGTQAGSWANTLFGWVIPLMGQSQDVHTWHHLGMWVIVVFAIAHIYAAIREDIMGRQSVVSTMISGYRTFKD